ncbi:MAG: hypothetical protein P3T54_00140 [Dehalogenimonas sp.]|nr:hypothetical protein [Dehalogenimonas sp.]
MKAKSHYHPYEITYDRGCCIWILENISSESWPRQPSSSAQTTISMAAAGAQMKPSQVMPNRGWIEVKAEVYRRLSLCGRDGGMCLIFFGYGVPEEELAKAAGISTDEARRGIYNSLGYISWGRKYPNPGPGIPARKVCRTPRGTYEEWCGRRTAQTSAARAVVSQKPAPASVM